MCYHVPTSNKPYADPCCILNTLCWAALMLWLKGAFCVWQYAVAFVRFIQDFFRGAFPHHPSASSYDLASQLHGHPCHPTQEQGLRYKFIRLLYHASFKKHIYLCHTRQACQITATLKWSHHPVSYPRPQSLPLHVHRCESMSSTLFVMSYAMACKYGCLCMHVFWSVCMLCLYVRMYVHACLYVCMHLCMYECM